MAVNTGAARESPLDEVQWWSLTDLQKFGGLHSNTILYYFADSPFFDKTSNNAIVWQQCNITEPEVISTRENFTARLMSMSGLEFMVVQEPEITGPGAGTGVWVIRKQTRRKRSGQDDEIIPHASYYVVDPYIYMAPTVAAVMSSRMLTMLSSMNKFMSVASSLPSFSPALGNTYMPPNTSRLKASESQQVQASRESSVVPVGLSDPKKVSSNSVAYDNALLNDSLQKSLYFDDEYMDDLPITGEPGNFHLATKSRVDKEKEKERRVLLTQAPITKGPLAAPAKPIVSPPTIKTDAQTLKKGEKGGKTPTSAGWPSKPKRKKTKILGGGGISPT